MSGLTYPAALDALAARGRIGIRLGLGRTRALLAGLGHPEDAVRGALVGGTNGKGSVLALAGAALRAAGHRVGLTPKPHLVSYRERLEIDGRPIEPEAFAALIDEVLPVADRVARRLGPATEFELLTAASFLWFARQHVDVAVVEVGLGGRLDATHAWDGGVAAITNVALDHTQWLGSTIREIAREKAAIIGPGDRAVTGATGQGLAVIARHARQAGAPLTVVEPAPLLGWDRDAIAVWLPTLGVTKVGLRGRHQAANVAVAEAILDELEVAGIARVGAAERRAGYAGARWPGRLELVEVPRVGAGGGPRNPRAGAAGGPRNPRAGAAGGPPDPRAGAAGQDQVDVLLDGAHNPAGAAALAQALEDLRPFLAGAAEQRPPPFTLVVGVMSDKDVRGVLMALAQPLANGQVICTQVDDARALPAPDLAAVWRSIQPETRPIVEPDPDAALDVALRTAPGPVIVAGSLYLVGRARAALVPDSLPSDPPVAVQAGVAADPKAVVSR